jgi:hypothetical protein
MKDLAWKTSKTSTTSRHKTRDRWIDKPLANDNDCQDAVSVFTGGLPECIHLSRTHRKPRPSRHPSNRSKPFNQSKKCTRNRTQIFGQRRLQALRNQANRIVQGYLSSVPNGRSECGSREKKDF